MNYDNTDEENNRILRDAIIAKRKAAIDDNSGIDAAQATRSSDNKISAIGRALSGFATANSRAINGGQQDDSIFDAIRGNGRQAVEDAIKAKKMKIEGLDSQLGTQNSLLKEGRDVANTKFGQDLATKQFDTSKADKEADNIRQAARDAEIGRHNTAEEGLSSENNRLNNDTRKEISNSNTIARQAADSQKSQEKAVKDQEKLGQGQDKAYSELRNHLETFRGNQAAKQAAVDSYSADKALEIVKNKKFLTTQDLTLLSSEVAKIATGGVPTEAGIKHLMPSNLATKAAELQNFLSSSPTDAQANEYVKRNMDYLDGMVKESKKTLNGYRSNILKGYKGRVKPEQYSEAENDYGLGAPVEDPSAVKDPFGNSSSPAASAAPLNSSEQDELNTLRAKYGR